MTGDDAFPRHRPNVGVVLFNAEGLTWIGRRADIAHGRRWQWPQGGVDPGEDHETAARRELAEETGVTSVDYLGRTQDWVTYDFPPAIVSRDLAMGRPGWLGQKQIWFAYRFTGEDSEINLFGHGEPEFDQWRWERLDRVVDMAAPFKREVYERVIAAFRSFEAD